MVTEEARMVRLETQMQNVCDRVDAIDDRLTIIDQKLDAALVNKADKNEVARDLKTTRREIDTLSSRIWAVVVVTIMSVPEVPTVPWQTTVVPSVSSSRKKVAVPVASALASAVIALAVATPAEAAPKAVADMGSWASSVLPESAALASAGAVPA
jgi:hypothetical protein